MKRRGKVKHPIFQDCMKLEKLGFWKKVFDDCSRGRFPAGIMFKGNELLFRKKRHKDPLVFRVSNDPQEVLLVVKQVFKEEIGLLSMDELTARQIKCDKYIKENVLLPTDASWQDLRSPLVRLRLIADYTIYVTETLGQSRFMQEQMYEVIVFGIASGVLSSEDITFTDFKIVDIAKVELLPGGWATTETLTSQLPAYERKVVRKRQKDMLEVWDKWNEQYMAAIRKRTT